MTIVSSGTRSSEQEAVDEVPGKIVEPLNSVSRVVFAREKPVCLVVLQCNAKGQRGRPSCATKAQSSQQLASWSPPMEMEVLSDAVSVLLLQFPPLLYLFAAGGVVWITYTKTTPTRLHRAL